MVILPLTWFLKLRECQWRICVYRVFITLCVVCMYIYIELSKEHDKNMNLFSLSFVNIIQLLLDLKWLKLDMGCFS